jgi:signal recognition particle receptor subunit beta
MARAGSRSEMHARIVFWGPEGSGKSTSLREMHARLKADAKGDLKQVPTRLDPTVTYEEFPIQIGKGSGRTELYITAVPGGPEHGPTRKQLLDQVDGIVLVLDAQADRMQANLDSVDELRSHLEAYGRSIEDIPVVVQYNKRDIGDSFAIEETHRQLGLTDTAVFETTATEGVSILHSLTTISKRVVRVLRDKKSAPAKTPSAQRAQPMRTILEEIPAQPVAAPSAIMEAAILSEEDIEDDAVADAVIDTQTALDESWPQPDAGIKQSAGARIGADLQIVSVGDATRVGKRSVRIPLVLGNDEGETVTLALKVQLDPLLDE